jgi:hypothetical protein
MLEIMSRNDKRLQRILKAARFKVTARTEDIDYRHLRGLKQRTIAGLQSNYWIAQSQNIVLTGPTC